MKKTVLTLAVLLFAVPFLRADEGPERTAEKDFTFHLDVLQPTAVVGSLEPGEPRNAWLIIGAHISGCRVGRLRACGLGFAWGTQRVDDGHNKVWTNSLLVTSPLGFRLNDPQPYAGEPELDFNVTPYYDTSRNDFGVSFGLSIGG
ncbi:MAG TPA: hypothetical protein VD862_00125 [Candidatus Paceibacterota bacterium]|nr:hypothetical protein [Candidatus Paceibacterota bacterium]